MAPRLGRDVSFLTHPFSALVVLVHLLAEGVAAFPRFLISISGLYLPPLITIAIGTFRDSQVHLGVDVL